MAATVKIIRWTGPTSAPTKTDITSPTNTVANAVDDPAPGTANPVQVPLDSSTKYSFWVSTRLSATAAPATAINNIKWYSNNTNLGSGVTLNVALASTSGAASGYRVATGTTGDTGNQLTTTNHTALEAATSTVGTYTSGSSLTVAGSIGSSTGDFGKFVVLQVAVTSAAGPGPTSSETTTFQFDES